MCPHILYFFSSALCLRFIHVASGVYSCLSAVESHCMVYQLFTYSVSDGYACFLVWNLWTFLYVFLILLCTDLWVELGHWVYISFIFQWIMPSVLQKGFTILYTHQHHINFQLLPILVNTDVVTFYFSHWVVVSHFVLLEYWYVAPFYSFDGQLKVSFGDGQISCYPFPYWFIYLKIFICGLMYIT